MVELWTFVESVLAFFFPPSLVATTLYTDLLLPSAQMFFGWFMLYWFLIKPVLYFADLIGGLPRNI